MSLRRNDEKRQCKEHLFLVTIVKVSLFGVTFCEAIILCSKDSALGVSPLVA